MASVVEKGGLSPTDNATQVLPDNTDIEGAAANVNGDTQARDRLDKLKKGYGVSEKSLDRIH